MHELAKKNGLPQHCPFQMSSEFPQALIHGSMSHSDGDYIIIGEKFVLAKSFY